MKCIIFSCFDKSFQITSDKVLSRLRSDLGLCRLLLCWIYRISWANTSDMWKEAGALIMTAEGQSLPRVLIIFSLCGILLRLLEQILSLLFVCLLSCIWVNPPGTNR